jgi:hypothetical protein
MDNITINVQPNFKKSLIIRRLTCTLTAPCDAVSVIQIATVHKKMAAAAPCTIGREILRSYFSRISISSVFLKKV